MNNKKIFQQLNLKLLHLMNKNNKVLSRYQLNNKNYIFLNIHLAIIHNKN